MSEEISFFSFVESKLLKLKSLILEFFKIFKEFLFIIGDFLLFKITQLKLLDFIS